jgi:hypothetical protein
MINKTLISPGQIWKVKDGFSLFVGLVIVQVSNHDRPPKSLRLTNAKFVLVVSESDENTMVNVVVDGILCRESTFHLKMYYDLIS